MKTKKLLLSKTTVSNLSIQQLDVIKGGVFTDLCTQFCETRPPINCPTVIQRTCDCY